MASNKTVRVIVAAIGIPVAASVIYAGGWVLVALLAVLAVAGALEVYRIGERAGLRPLTVVGTVGAALMPAAAYAALPAGGAVPARALAFAAVVWFIVNLSVGTFSRQTADRPLASVAVTLFGAVYAGAMIAFLVPIRHAPGLPSPLAAAALVLLPLATTWICDSVAMEVGSRVGGPKLAPTLSPKKTWSGAVGGSIGAVVAAPLYGVLLLERFGVALPLWQLALFGLLVSVVGQIGDVSESLFKREVGIKDSGAFFPGHGGVLDRLDSLYWVIPTSAILLAAFGVV
jgi:phosphatidate cytidylyltransferase